MQPAANPEIPAHLKAYIVDQDYDLYTPMDHAGWRMILRLSQKFFAQNAHQKYLDGLRETGISIDRIPRISEMDEKLNRFGWRAVAVSGFIPPAIFMEFFSRGILPIACDMRMIENLTYTPAPDIVHEAAGHAPIIADPAYSEYLRRYGDVSTKAIFNQEDIELYLAVRNLSEVKENPRATREEIAAAQARLDKASHLAATMGEPSEAALMARMNWWTVEYGLVGEINAPKIYGAGLLSSLGESYHCLESHVAKIGLSVNCVDVSYDITRPQPQLFVARDFAQLTEVLDEFAATMAFRRGGVEGLKKARAARAVITVELDSGLQISGVLSEFDAASALRFLKFSGPVQLAYQSNEISNHGVKTHAQGFSSPLGKAVRGNLSKMPIEAIRMFAENIEFDSGYRLRGKLTGEISREGKRLVLCFTDCTVWNPAGAVIYQPEWGPFDLAIGSQAISVFGGPADLIAYYGEHSGSTELLPSKPKQKSNLTEENRDLNVLYGKMRALRELGPEKVAEPEIEALISSYERMMPRDWLLKYEVCEFLDPTHRQWNSALQSVRERWLSDLKLLAKTKTPEGEVLARAFQFLH